MELYLSIILAFALLPLQAWCQTVQDAWTAPAAPDGSTPLQSGTKFTLLWKSELQNSFKLYCPSCNVTKLDLWITNFNGTKYTSKIGRGVDLTTTSSYDWNVNIASDAFSDNDFWTFRFTFFDSTDPYYQQISSPGFKISGLVKASSTTSAQSSSSTSAAPASSSIATTSTSISSSSSSTSQPTEKPSTPSPPSKSNTWIAGVVIGPLVGLALGAALMWFCLRKRKNKKVQQNQGNVAYDQGGYYQEFSADQGPKEMYAHTVNIAEAPDSMSSAQPAEVAGTTSSTQPAELWGGNHRSQS